jgi:type IV pilus assembly protein PilF
VKINVKIMLLSTVLSILSGCVSNSSTERSNGDIPNRMTQTERAKAHTDVAVEYFRSGRLGVALDSVQQALAVSSEYSPALNMRGLIYMELQENIKAKESFEAALKYAPADSDVLNNLGWFMCQRGDISKSMEYFRQALRNPLYSTPERALLNGGICARKLGDLPAAELNLLAALDRNPQLAQAQLQLADIEFSKGKMREAGERMTRYLNLDTAPSVETLLLAVKIARGQGDRNQEASYVQQMRKRFPESELTRTVLENR